MTAGADRAGPQPAPASNCRRALLRLRGPRGAAQSPIDRPITNGGAGRFLCEDLTVDLADDRQHGRGVAVAEDVACHGAPPSRVSIAEPLLCLGAASPSAPSSLSCFLP